jgi:cytochrome c biogenesis protein CcdA
MPAFILPILIVVHVTLAIALFVPSLLLPFTQRRRSRGDAPDAPGRVVRALGWLQAKGSLPLGIGLGLSGLGLIAILGAAVLRQPWLLVALGIYAIDLGLAYFVQRPAVKRLAVEGAGGESTYDARAVTARGRRQRYLSYLMAGLIGTIGLLMSTKPVLW